MINGLIDIKNNNTLPCPRCGAIGALKIGQLHTHGKLRWFESVRCNQCGLNREADGIGFPPIEMRNFLINNEGLWAIKIDHVKSLINTIKTIKTALSIDMNAASSLIKNNSKIIFSGTKGEALWLIDLLEKCGESPVLLANENNKAQPFQPASL